MIQKLIVLFFCASLAQAQLTREEAAGAVQESHAELAAKRWQARQDKDWAASDALRDELKEKGWVMKDGKEDYTVEPA